MKSTAILYDELIKQQLQVHVGIDMVQYSFQSNSGTFVYGL